MPPYVSSNVDISLVSAYWHW